MQKLFFSEQNREMKNCEAKKMCEMKKRRRIDCPLPINSNTTISRGDKRSIN